MPTGAIVVGAVALAAAFASTWILWQIAHVLLVVFAGILLAVIWRNLGVRLAAVPGISPRAGTSLVIAFTFLGGAAFVWGVGPLVASQMDQLVQNVTDAITSIEGQVREYWWGRWLFDEALPSLNDGGTGSDLLGRITGIFSTAFGVVMNLIFILMIGIYTAVAPHTYRSGILKLVPREHRERADEILHGIGHGLWHWLLGQLIAMLGVGLTTAVGLWIIGIPLAIVLGIIAGILNFIPLLGPILSAIPALLVGFSQSPTDALYVLLVFLGVQQLEGNILTPLVQHRAVHLPPAVILSSLLAFGVLFGTMGVLLATPLAVVVAVFVRMVYIEEVLEETATVT